VEFELASEEETTRLGRAIADLVEVGTVIGLVGPLGAGKTRLVRSIAEALGVEPARAEQEKRSRARIAPAGTAPDAVAAKLDRACRSALGPLVREIRQTLASFRAAARAEVGVLHVTGGAARLRGLLPFLEEELGVPAVFLRVPNTLQGGAGGADAGDEGTPIPAGWESPDDGDTEAEVAGGARPATFGARGASEPSPFALATAIGLAASRGGREIDLRRGPYVYRASFSVIRQKAAHLAVLAGAILVAGGFDVSAALSNLGNERKVLDAQLKTATQELFGQPRSDAQAVTRTLRKGFKEELAPIPKATAYDLLSEISKKLPPADSIELDVAELDIRPKKTFMKGTVDSATAVDEIAAKLKEIPCYEDVVKGAITEVSEDAKQFTLTVTARCP